jgi:hypothetical protein
MERSAAALKEMTVMHALAALAIIAALIDRLRVGRKQICRVSVLVAF